MERKKMLKEIKPVKIVEIIIQGCQVSPQASKVVLVVCHQVK